VSQYRKDAVVYRQSCAADDVCYIQDGKVEIVVACKQRKKAVVAILGSGEFFGVG
jgi:CRP-like cAMP-binding protein